MWLLRLPRVARHRARLRENRGGHLLGGGLAVAAGDADQRDGELLAPAACRALPAPPACPRPRSAASGVGCAALDHGAGGAGRRRRRRRIVAVEARPAQRHEQLAARRACACRSTHAVKLRVRALQPAAAGAREFRERALHAGILAQRVADDRLVAERAPLVAVDLVVLVALARDQHHIIAGRSAPAPWRIAQRAVMLDDDAAWPPMPARMSATMRARVLAARIVVGDDDVVGELRGDARPSAGACPRRGRRRSRTPRAGGRGSAGARRAAPSRSASGRVRVVDDRQRRAPAAAKHLHAAVAAPALAPARARPRASGTSQASSTASTVSTLSTLKSPISGTASSRACPSSIRSRARGRAVGAARARHARIAATARDVAARGRVVTMSEPQSRGAGQLGAEGIVDVDDPAREVRPGEQPRLGGRVGLHGAVVVEMVAREVGERGGVEAHAIDARLVQRMRGHFHATHSAPQRAQLRELPLHGDGIGGGVQRRRQLRRAARSPACRCRPPGGRSARAPARAATRRWSCRWCR